MSTRATYSFEDGRGRWAVYIHHDGYLEGAGYYFAAACKHANRRGGFAERFIRANDGAELTGGHDAHGDTEFQYTLTRVGGGPGGAPFLSVRARGGNEWRGIFAATMAEFLNRYGPEDERGTWRNFGAECVTVAELTERARAEAALARHSAEKGWSGNASSQCSGVARFIRAGAEFDRAEFEALVALCCAAFPHMIEHHKAEAFTGEGV